jgi:hypothetical protein
MIPQQLQTFRMAAITGLNKAVSNFAFKTKQNFNFLSSEWFSETVVT